MHPSVRLDVIINCSLTCVHASASVMKQRVQRSRQNNVCVCAFIGYALGVFVRGSADIYVTNGVAETCRHKHVVVVVVIALHIDHMSMTKVGQCR